MKTCIYPGTFDPITIGHLDIIKRAGALCDQLILAIFQNKSKNCMFGLQDRLAMVRLGLGDFDQSLIAKTQIVTFDNLLVDLAKDNQTPYVIRGMRNVADFEYEQNLFQVNRMLYQEFESIFLIAKNDHKHISSSLVRELITLKGDYCNFVTPRVHNFIAKQGL